MATEGRNGAMAAAEGRNGAMATEGSVRCPANYIPLTPITFLERSAVVYADQKAVIDGEKTYTWKQTRDRCVRLASALTQHHISRGDVVS